MSAMNEAPVADYILQSEKFKGEITINNQQVAINLTASADASGQLSLDVDPIPHPSEGSSELMRSLSKPGYSVNEFMLDCKSSSGKRLKSDRAYLMDCVPSSERLYIRLRILEARLNMAAHETHNCPVLRFHFLGFRCLGCAPAESNLGLVNVQGEIGTPDTNKITGHIVIQAADNNTRIDWQKEAEHLLWHLRLVLSFASGVFLPVPVIEFYEGDHVEVTFNDVDDRHPLHLPPLSHFNFGRIIKTAIDSTNAVEKDRGAFKTAINWLLVPTTYAEVQFLTGMTALESLTSRSMKELQVSSILGASAFKKLAQGIRKLIDAQNHLDDTVREEIKIKIPELNRPQLHTKIDVLLDKWKIERVLIDETVIKHLINHRNSIVHKGISPGDDDLWLSILYVREILVRLVLAMLKFNGGYQCYINGCHERRFPSCKPTS